MTVTPSAVVAASSTTLTFRYTAGSCGRGRTAGGGHRAGRLDAAEHVAGDARLCRLGGQSPAVSVRTDDHGAGGNLEPGTVIVFEYETAQAPGSSGSYTFTAGQSGGDGSLQQLGSSPVVMVTPPVVSTTPPPPASPAAQ